MKHVIYLLPLILLTVSCGTRNRNIGSATPSDDQVTPVVRTTISYATTDYKYCFFGYLDNPKEAYDEDTLSFPPIEGLVHKTGVNVCPIDSCHANYYVLAAHCPDNVVLRKWLSRKFREYADNGDICYEWKLGAAERETDAIEFDSLEEMCSYYIDVLTKNGDYGTCPEMGLIHPSEYGFLLADCWNKGELCTFYEIMWGNDGHFAHEAYHTVDARTGKDLTLADFVAPENYDSLSTLLMPRILCGDGDTLISQSPEHYSVNDKNVLRKLSSCALIEEGLIIYFFPYNLNAGNYGEYEAIIQYDKLDGILRPGIL